MPDAVASADDGGHGIEEHQPEPYHEDGVLLPEGLSCRYRAALSGIDIGGRVVDGNLPLRGVFHGLRPPPSYRPAEAELQEAGRKGDERQPEEHGERDMAVVYRAHGDGDGEGKGHEPEVEGEVWDAEELLREAVAEMAHGDGEHQRAEEEREDLACDEE